MSIPASLEEDYRALRQGVGAIPLSRDVLAVRGPDAAAYLQGQCSQDVEEMADGTAVDALVLSPQGKIDVLVRVHRRSGDEFVLDVDGGFGDALRARLERFRLRVKVEFEPLDWGCVGIRGPNAGAVLEPAGSAAGTELTVPFGWGGVTGVDLLGPGPAAPAGVRACSSAAWEAVRIESGMPAMGTDVGEGTIPAEAGLVERCVSFTKGCYTGQELVARLDARGSNVARRLLGLVVGGLDGPEAASVVGSALEADGKPSGEITSAAWSPGLEAVVALGYLHRRVPVGATVDVVGPGALSEVVAEVRELPLR